MRQGRATGRARLLAPRRFGLVAHRASQTNLRLGAAALKLGQEARLLEPREARTFLRRGDLALARLDVLRNVDGVEPGSEVLRELEAAGVEILNAEGALLASHDKLATAEALTGAGIRHPRTWHVRDRLPPEAEPPLVVKPRFGSWGKDVALCRTRAGLGRCLRSVREREWFRRHGALVQELVPPRGRDLRVVVAGGEVVGAIERIAPRGEWRTNVAIGGKRHPTDPPLGARLLALEATTAIGIDLAGVDLLPDAAGGYVVLEVNGAVDFTQEYALGDGDVFEHAIAALLRASYARRYGQEAQAEEAIALAPGAGA